MKKLLVVVMLFAGTSVFANNGKVLNLETLEESKIVVVDNNDTKNNNTEVLFDTCGDLGNMVYDDARAEGANHRTARAIRRQFVRNCRASITEA